MMKRLYFYLLLVIFAVSMLLSLLFSKQVYGTLFRVWCARPGALSADELVDRVYAQNKSGADLVKDATLLYTIFPENKKVNLLYARALLTQRLQLATAVSLLSLMADKYPSDKEIATELLRAMYTGGYFSDIVTFIGDYKGSISEAEQLKIYGISLYKTGHVEKSLEILSSSLRSSASDTELTYYLALCYEKLSDKNEKTRSGNLRKAVFYMESSRSYPLFQSSDYLRILKKAGRSDSIQKFLSGDL